jgi:hypothetical protein
MCLGLTSLIVTLLSLSSVFNSIKLPVLDNNIGLEGIRKFSRVLGRPNRIKELYLDRLCISSSNYYDDVAVVTPRNIQLLSS